MNYPPPERIASPTELRQYYEKAVAEIDSLRNTRRSERAVSSKNRQEALESRKQVKKLSREVVTLTKKQKAKEEANKCGYWSGAATVSVTMLYETWRVVGFPGGKAWLEWWNHEAIFGAITWATTMPFASFYRATQGK